MALKVLQISMGWMLNTLKNNWETLTLRLYVNDRTPADADTSADYAEANFSGYAPVPTSAWADAVANPDAVHWQVQSTPVTFTHNGGAQTNNVYGYFLTRPSGLGGAFEVVWAERLSNPPVAMGVLGDFITIVPTLQDRSEF
jgi:hypothetical protein